MKIVAPARSADMVRALLEAGADEFYCGVEDKTWLQEYGNSVEYNRRGNYGAKANFAGREEWREAVALAAARGKLVALTVNALHIGEQQAALLEPLLDAFAQAGGDAVIITDLSMLEPVKHRGLRVFLSSCAGVTNAACARFYRSLGVARIILPRDLTLADIAQIIAGCPGVEYEAFLINEPCRFADGNCLGLHNTRAGALCRYLDDAPKSYRAFGGELVFSQAEFRRNGQAYATFLRQPCGLCAVYDLMRAGVGALKISGRLLSGTTLARQTALACENIRLAAASADCAAFLAQVRRDDEAACARGGNCYYTPRGGQGGR